MTASRPTLPVTAAPILNNRMLALCCGGLLAAYAWFLAAAWAHGFSLFGPGRGTTYDFACFWAAGRLALAGHAAAAYHWLELRHVLETETGAQFGGGTLPWVYPPLFFVAVTPFALFPYAIAAALWAGTTLAAYLAAIRAILPGGTATIAALAAPPVIANLWSGQNGLLTAGLLGGALALLDRRPVLAGLLVGVLAYKPQFGVLLPLMLAITGRWLVFAVAAMTVSGLVLFSGAVFGWDTFLGFAQAFGLARTSICANRGTLSGSSTGIIWKASTACCARWGSAAWSPGRRISRWRSPPPPRAYGSWWAMPPGRLNRRAC
jgi:hypothetical protein